MEVGRIVGGAVLPKEVRYLLKGFPAAEQILDFLIAPRLRRSATVSPVTMRMLLEVVPAAVRRERALSTAARLSKRTKRLGVKTTPLPRLAICFAILLSRLCGDRGRVISSEIMTYFSDRINLYMTPL